MNTTIITTTTTTTTTVSITLRRIILYYTSLLTPERPLRKSRTMSYYFIMYNDHDILSIQTDRGGALWRSLQVLCWRTVPVRNNQIGEVARSSEPFIRQAFVVDAADVYDEDDFKRRVFALRKRSTHTIPKPGRRFYICSLSHTIIVYKGQFTSDQLWAYFTDLQVIIKKKK